MKTTLYDHFNQAAVLQTLNQIPRFLMWATLGHTFFAANEDCLNLFGFSSQDQAEGKLYSHIPCKAAECYPEFVKLDERVIKSGSVVESLGLYCYDNGDWKVIRSTKSLIKSPDGQALGICTDFAEVKNLPTTQFLAQLMQLERHLKSRKDQMQVSYGLADRISPAAFSITDRQTECLFYLLRGFTVPMIAEKLFVSTRTVESHIENIKLAVGCDTKSDLLEKALMEGWIGIMPKHLLKK